MEKAMPRWAIKTKDVVRVVEAVDQDAAWDTLRGLPVHAFGLVVTAERDEDGDPIAVRTSALMLAWGRDADAAAIREAVVAVGGPDTETLDREFAARRLGQ